MKIDLVYTYVNGNDREWFEKRNSYSENQNECRYRDNDELLYSLRTVEKFAPWINHIFIVTDSKMPDWFNNENTKVTIIRHEDIIPSEYLPCFNSNVIESFIPYIKGLSEHYIYANDDMMFGNTVSPSFFFSDGKPIVRCFDRGIERGMYYNFIKNSQEAFLKRTSAKYHFLPYHNIDAYSKTAMKDCLLFFEEEFSSFRKNMFREKNDLNRVIFQYYMVNEKAAHIKIYKNSKLEKIIRIISRIIFPSRYLDYFVCDIDFLFSNTIKGIFYRYLLKKGPKVFCINDGENTSEEDLIKYKNFMKKKFYQKSSFEI